MFADDVGHEMYELCAMRLGANFFVALNDLGLGPWSIKYRYLRPQPADDATTKVHDESVRVSTCAQSKGAKSLVACGQRLERLGRRLGAGKVIVPAVFPTRVSARSMLRA